MKRGDLLRHLRRHGCYLKREGASHSLWCNPGFDGRPVAISRAPTLVKKAVGTIVALIGLFFLAVGLALFTGLAHIDSPAHAVAWTKWHSNPSAVTEAAWRREQRRVLLEEGGVLVFGGVLLAAGVWLQLEGRERHAYAERVRE